MQQYESAYIDLIKLVEKYGYSSSGRNGDTIAVNGWMLQFPATPFPILQGRKIYHKGVVGELATFLEGPRDLQHFKDNGCNFWDKWADENGKLKLDYGNAWKDAGFIFSNTGLRRGNQLKEVVENITVDPHSRRHIINGWVPRHVWSNSLSLPCCHYSYQFIVRHSYLDLIWIQRSADLMVGVPSNMISATLLLHLMAQTTGYKVGTVSMQLGNVHIYHDHLPKIPAYREQANEVMYSPAKISISKNATVFNFSPSDFAMIKYEHAEPISFNLHE